MNEFMMIGEILKPQGIHGELKIRPYAADIDCFRRWKTLYLKKGAEYSPVKFTLTRIHEEYVYAILDDCSDMNQAETYRGQSLYIDRAHANPLEKGQVYICDLIGCKAYDPAGNEIGTVTDVLQTGQVDIYVFKTSHGTMMAPALKRVFPEFRISERRISVIPELLEEVAVFED